MSTQVRFVVLGHVGVVVDDQHLQPSAARIRALLAALLLSFPRPLSHDALVELVWGEPASPNSVYVTLTRLRRWLAERGGVDVLHDVGGYRLQTSTEKIDAQLFLHLTRQAEQAEGTARLSLLQQALQLWPEGEVAEATTDMLREHPVAAELNRVRVRAATALGNQAAELGVEQQALAHVQRLAASQPLDEPLQATLSLLLAGVGRQADALAVIERTRLLLVEELGVDPGRVLQEAQMSILQHKEPIQRGQAEGTPAPGKRSRSSSWLGLAPSSIELVGREADLAQLTQLLSRRQLVNVVGPGGVGKTALALQVAQSIKNRFDRVVALPLVGASSADELSTAIAELLKIDATTSHAIRLGIEAALADRPTLLLLDNCEHLTAECAALARNLLGVARELVILATSREPLGMPTETCWRLDPLAVDVPGASIDKPAPAVALFQLRASQTDHTYQAGPGDLSQVARICRRLGGLPLAIEIAAARIGTVRPAEMAGLLDRDLGLLDVPRPGTEPRHRTLQATVDWSWRLLEPACQRLLARLSTFVVGFAMDDVVQVCGMAPLSIRSVPALLSQLVDRSLVQAYQTATGRRFRLLEVIREFAAERLADWGESTTCAEAHLQRWLQKARELDAVPLYNPRLELLLSWTEDADNLYTVLDHAAETAQAENIAELVARGFEFWLTGPGRLLDGLARLKQVLASGAGTDEVRCLARYWSGFTAANQLDYRAARQTMLSLLDQLRQLRPREYRYALACLTTSSTAMLDPAALSYTDTMLAEVSKNDSIDLPTTTPLSSAVFAALTWGRLEQASELFDHTDRWCERMGVPVSTVQLAQRAEWHVARGQLGPARHIAAQLFRRLFETGDPAESESPWRAITMVYLGCDQPKQAWRFSRRGLQQLTTRWVGGISRTLPIRVLHAEASRRCGRLENATVTLDGVLSEALWLHSHEIGSTAVVVCALLAADIGDQTAATDLISYWEEVRTRLGLPAPIGLASAVRSTFGCDTSAPRIESPTSDEPKLHELTKRALEWLRHAEHQSLIGMRTRS